MRLLLFFVCCLAANISTSLHAQCGASDRFQKQVFTNITVTKDITYGSADRYDVLGANNPQPIKLDFYAPQGDTMQRRPLVILFFGGGFTLGDKGDADMKAWCDSLAHYGYAAASVNYRLGYSQLSGKSAVRATYRAVQDARAAVRFLKEKYAQYAIDTNKIFIGGESAGAMTALHAAFLNSEADRPIETFGIVGENQDLGCLDCSGNTYQHTMNFKGIISLWGAINDVNNITANERIPTLLIHGTNDAIININQGAPFNLLTYPDVYGSNPLHARFDALGIYNEFYPYQGQPHLFYGIPTVTVTFPNQYWEPVWTQGHRFLYTVLQQLCVGTNTQTETADDLIVNPNPVHDNLHISFKDANDFEPYTLEITDINGRIMLKQNLTENITNITIQNFASGVYLAKATTKNKIFRRKFIVE